MLNINQPHHCQCSTDQPHRSEHVLRECCRHTERRHILLEADELSMEKLEWSLSRPTDEPVEDVPSGAS